MKYVFRALANPILEIFGPDTFSYFLGTILFLFDALIVISAFNFVRAKMTKKAEPDNAMHEILTEHKKQPSWFDILPIMFCVVFFGAALVNLPIFSGDLFVLNFGVIIFLIWACCVWGLYRSLYVKLIVCQIK